MFLDKVAASLQKCVYPVQVGVLLIGFPCRYGIVEAVVANKVIGIAVVGLAAADDFTLITSVRLHEKGTEVSVGVENPAAVFIRLVLVSQKERTVSCNRS